MGTKTKKKISRKPDNKKYLEEGKRLATLREMTGLSQEDMSTFLDISLRHYQRFENGSNVVTYDCMKKLHEEYGFKYDYIMTGKLSDLIDKDKAKDKEKLPKYNDDKVIELVLELDISKKLEICKLLTPMIFSEMKF